MSIKVGDKIRVTRSTWDIEVGVHEVVAVGGYGSPSVYNKYNSLMYIQDESSYELVEEKEMNQFKVGDLVVSNEDDMDIVKGKVYTLTGVDTEGTRLYFKDDVGFGRSRPSENYTLHNPETKRVTLADREVKEGMKYVVDFTGADPVELAEAFKEQARGYGSTVGSGELLQGVEGEVDFNYHDGDFNSVEECVVVRDMFKYLTLTNAEEFNKPKELVKGYQYLVGSTVMYFVGLDDDKDYIFSDLGLKYAVREGSCYGDYITASIGNTEYLSKEEALKLQEA